MYVKSIWPYNIFSNAYAVTTLFKLQQTVQEINFKA